MAVILTKLLIIKLVSEIQCLIHWFFLLFYVGSSHLRVAVCWNTNNAAAQASEGGSHLRVAVCWNFVGPATQYTKIRSHLRVAVCWNTHWHNANGTFYGSHLRVAVCWNIPDTNKKFPVIGSHLRVAVCWNLTGAFNMGLKSAATFGRLCVETLSISCAWKQIYTSHLRWLYVETNLNKFE